MTNSNKSLQILAKNYHKKKLFHLSSPSTYIFLGIYLLFYFKAHFRVMKCSSIKETHRIKIDMKKQERWQIRSIGFQWAAPWRHNKMMSNGIFSSYSAGKNNAQKWAQERVSEIKWILRKVRSLLMRSEAYIGKSHWNRRAFFVINIKCK